MVGVISTSAYAGYQLPGDESRRLDITFGGGKRPLLSTTLRLEKKSSRESGGSALSTGTKSYQGTILTDGFVPLP